MLQEVVGGDSDAERVPDAVVGELNVPFTVTMKEMLPWVAIVNPLPLIPGVVNVNGPSTVPQLPLAWYRIEKAVITLLAIVNVIVFPCEVVPLQLPS